MPLPVMKAALLTHKKRLLQALDQQTLAAENSLKLDLKANPDMTLAHVHVYDELAGLYPRPLRPKKKAKTT